VGCRFATDGAEEPADPGLAALIARIGAEHEPHAERRTAVRVPYTECVGIDVEGGVTVRGFARDLSRGGIAFFCATRLAAGVIHLTLPQGADAEPLRVRAKVVRCTPLVEGFYDVAARFVGG
ncbi:MAG: PilZ domain-containing protein, partial [Gemmataceae bacterium]